MEALQALAEGAADGDRYDAIREHADTLADNLVTPLIAWEASHRDRTARTDEALRELGPDVLDHGTGYVEHARAHAFAEEFLEVALAVQSHLE